MEKEGKAAGDIDSRTLIKAGRAASAGAALASSAIGNVSGSALTGDDIADKPLLVLSQMIRKREISSRELVDIYLARIEKFDGRKGLNSYITVVAEQAREQSERLDKLAKSGQFQGPLHGIPIAVKDNLDTSGIRTTGGTSILQNWYPTQSATVVERLQKAGAIIVGKTNMHEFAQGITTNNPHYGPTRNPYDYSRIPGGSSGGSAAATAAALCACSLGTDTGGSIRIPAGMCGVVGVKPTVGRVGRGGMMGLSYTRDVIGPITRTVTDSALMLSLMTGADPRDSDAVVKDSIKYRALSANALRGKRFGVPKKYFFDDIDPDVENTMNLAFKAIEKAGGSIREVEVASADLAPETGFQIVLPEAVYLIEEYLRAFDPHATIEKCLDQMGPDVKGAFGSQKGPEAKPIAGYAYVEAVRKNRVKLIEGYSSALAGLDALLVYTTPLPAPPIGDDVETELNGTKVSTFATTMKSTDPVSIVGFPAVSVPAGYSSKGLPIGLQIIARPWEENKLLNIAYAFEQATRVRKPPKLGTSS